MAEEQITLHDERTDSRLNEVWRWQHEHDTEVRTHYRNLFVIAGALSSFSMPLLGNHAISHAPKMCIGLALVSFLTLLLIGFLRMRLIITDAGNALADLRKGLQSQDQQALSRYRQREQDIKKERSWGDVYGTALHAFFALGTLLLILAVVLVANSCDAVSLGGS